MANAKYKGCRVMSNLRKPLTMLGRPDMKSGPFTLYRRPCDSDDGWQYYVQIDRPSKPTRLLGPSNSVIAHKRFVKLVQTYSRRFSVSA